MAPDDTANITTGAAQTETVDALLIEEAEALALFIARRGTMLGDDQARKDAYAVLRDAIARAEAGEAGSEQALLEAYSTVSAFTYADYEINGRTILDTDGKGEFRRKADQHVTGRDGGNGFGTVYYRLFKPQNRPLLYALVLFGAVLLFELALLLTLKLGFTEIHAGLEFVKNGLRPLVWGAIGTCAFLMKRISDKLSAFAFEEARARGMGTRVFLGAVMGLMVIEIINASDSESLKAFPVYLIAFLAGLGVKPVYAAIEGLVEGIAARINLPTDGKKS